MTRSDLAPSQCGTPHDTSISHSHPTYIRAVDAVGTQRGLAANVEVSD